MPQSLSKIYVHLIFCTKNREPALPREILPKVHAYIAGTLNAMDCPAISVGGTPDHVHALFALGKNSAPAKVVEEPKRSATVWIKSNFPNIGYFAWQPGYGAFSVRQSNVDTVRRYICEQETHHHAMSFNEELQKFCEKYGLDYDPRFW